MATRRAEDRDRSRSTIADATSSEIRECERNIANRAKMIGRGEEDAFYEEH